LSLKFNYKLVKFYHEILVSSKCILPYTSCWYDNQNVFLNVGRKFKSRAAWNLSIFLQWESNPSVNLQSGVIPARINWRDGSRRADWWSYRRVRITMRNAWKNLCRIKKEMERNERRNDFTKDFKFNRTNVHTSCTHREHGTSPSYQWNWYRLGIRTCSAIDILGLCLN